MKKTPPNNTSCGPSGMTATDIHRIHRHGRIERRPDDVVVEQALTIMVHRLGSFTVMCTPTDMEALTVGFLFSEGMITDAAEVLAISAKDDLPNVVGVEIERPTVGEIPRNLVVASSCGMCGVRNIEKMLSQIPPCPQQLTLDQDVLFAVVERMQSKQILYRATGGAHAADIFDRTGRSVAFAEDIGRHNALDKAIGKYLLGGETARGLGVALSGRASLEMVSKAARAGIELIVAVSGVSSAALEAAEHWNITLCGYTRDDRSNIYTHPQRIKQTSEPSQ